MAFIPFQDGQMAGAIAVNVFALLCATALVSVGVKIAWLGIQVLLSRNSGKPQEYVFFSTQLGNYAACLLFGMLINTSAGILALNWLIARGITEGPICTAQAFLLQMGTWSSGFFTVTIAIHTCNTLVLRRKQSAILSRSIMCAGWGSSALMSTIPFLLEQTDGEIYGADGFMCGVRAVYPNVQFLLHVLPILIASVLSVALYSVIFLVLRGTLSIKGGVRLNLDPHHRWEVIASDNYQLFISRIARSMIWYPVAYVTLLVPYSIMRLLAISGYPVPFEANVFAAVCWFALGVVNVILFYNTFRILEPAFEGSSSTSPRRDMEKLSFNFDNNDQPASPFSFPEEKSTFQNSNPRATRGFHLPRHAQSRSSIASNTSQDQLLALYENNSAVGIAIGSPSNEVASPRPALQKAEVLATHSPKSSVSSSVFASHSPLFREPLSSSNPFESGTRAAGSSPNSPMQQQQQVPTGLWRTESWSSTESFEFANSSPTAAQSAGTSSTSGGSQYRFERTDGTTVPPLSAFGTPVSGRVSPPRRKLTLLTNERRGGAGSPESQGTPKSGGAGMSLVRSFSRSPDKQRPLILPTKQSQAANAAAGEYPPYAYTNPRPVPSLPSRWSSRS